VNNIRNEEFLKAFGSNLRKLRKEKGLSMERLAQIAGIEYSQVSDIEHGKINTTLSSVFVLAKALEIRPSILLEFDYPVIQS
jgi:transcriptional regulator with XRE-family HTH domain